MDYFLFCSSKHCGFCNFTAISFLKISLNPFWMVSNKFPSFVFFLISPISTPISQGLIFSFTVFRRSAHVCPSFLWGHHLVCLSEVLILPFLYWARSTYIRWHRYGCHCRGILSIILWTFSSRSGMACFIQPCLNSSSLIVFSVSKIYSATFFSSVVSVVIG